MRASVEGGTHSLFSMHQFSVLHRGETVEVAEKDCTLGFDCVRL